MNMWAVFSSAVYAGAAIGLGATAYLCVGGVAGALLFGVGLFIVVERRLQLFTGRMCRVIQDDILRVYELPMVFMGNMLGAMMMAGLVRLAHIETGVNALVAAKVDMLAVSWAAILVRGALCNICIYLATRGYAHARYELGRYLALFLGVAVFVHIGAEHCVADMFYFFLSDITGAEMFLVVLLAAIGNTLGGGLCEVFSLLLEETPRDD